VWRLVGGSEYERRWWGPAKDVQSLLPSLRAGATEVAFDQSPGSVIGIATVRYAGVQNFNDVTSEVMVVSFTDQSFPLHQNPSFISIPNSTIKELEEALKREGENLQDPDSDAWKYYDLRSRGVETYRAKLPVVSWQRIVGNQYPTALDIADVGTIFSTAQIVDQLGAPVLWSIPDANVGVSEGDASLFTAGWIKDCEVGYTADGQNQLVIRAEFGLWANDAYTFGF
jgi:hypothetical protein